jgi:hypothetical protein
MSAGSPCIAESARGIIGIWLALIVFVLLLIVFQSFASLSPSVSSNPTWAMD